MFFPSYFEWWHLPIVFIAGIIGEGYGSLVGGGSIVIQSCLIFLGLPPHAAVAIDNAGAIGSEIGIISVAWKKVLKYKKLILLLTAALIIGGILGTHIFINLDKKIIEYLMVAMVSIMLIYSFRKKQKIKKPSNKHYILLFSLFIFIGFYNNIIGIGEGTFSRIALMSLLGLTFVECQGLKTLGTIPIRIYSWIITAMLGFIIYPYLITLLIANFFAGRYATKLSIHIPEKIMMKILTVVSIFFILYILFF